MKLATEHNNTPDGRLLVVSRDLTQVADAAGIAATLQDALERWQEVSEALQALYEQLNVGITAGARAYGSVRFAAPLPRAWQWLDGSAYDMHAELMAKAFNLPPIEHKYPLMYQGLSHRFYGPEEDVPFRSEADGIDFEGEFGIITGRVPIGTAAEEAVRYIHLAVQINDWSLRSFAVPEMKTGFGWILAKPACSVAPVAITLDELGAGWEGHRVVATLEVKRNGERFGAVPGNEMGEGFDVLLAHAARTRELCAGTLIGSGTVSHSGYRDVGSCCIAERRAIEIIESGEACTAYLHFGEEVSMQVWRPDSPVPLFGELRQKVVPV